MSSILKGFHKLLQNFNRSMFGKILLSHITLIIIPVILIGLLSFYASKNIIDKQLVRINASALNQVEVNIDNLIGNVYQLSTLYSLDSEIEQIVKNPHSDDMQKLYEQRNLEDKITNYSLSFDQLRTHTMIIGYNGSVFTSKHDAASVTLDKVIEKNWYTELQSNKRHMLWFHENPGFSDISSNTPVITFGKAMKGQNSSNEYGICLFSLEESIFYDLYKNIPDTDSQMYIVDSKGKILSHSNRELTGSTLTSSELDNLLSQLPSSSDFKMTQNNHYINFIKKVNNMDWYIVYSIPEASNFRVIGSLKNEILIVAIICFIFSLIFAFFIARYFSIPIVRLTKRIRTYLTSFSNNEREEANAFEIDILSSEYELLIERLENTIKQLITEQEEKRKAELHALQMQINPHFLYNTLNSVKCLLWTGRTDLIEPTLTALIKLFRQTISRKDEIIPLEDELECIRNYVFIQQIRTSSPIDLIVHISDDIKKCRIPKLLLQPIVENAIFHGLEPKNTKGRVTIFCTVKEDLLSIEVEDNGVGMEEATVAGLLDGTMSPPESSGHIGVKNVHERIRLMYGPDYGIKVQSRPGVGTQVLLQLPLIINKEESNV